MDDSSIAVNKNKLYKKKAGNCASFLFYVFIKLYFPTI